MGSAQTEHGWSCLVSPASIPLPWTGFCVQQSLSKTSLSSLLTNSAAPWLGFVLTQGSELLPAWLGHLGKNTHEQFSLGVFHTSLILGTV